MGGGEIERDFIGNITDKKVCYEVRMTDTFIKKIKGFWFVRVSARLIRKE